MELREDLFEVRIELEAEMSWGEAIELLRNIDREIRRYDDMIIADELLPPGERYLYGMMARILSEMKSYVQRRMDVALREAT